MTDATLWLSRREGHEDENSNSNWSVHSAEVLRSKNTRSNAWCLFQIRDGVLVPYGSDT
ncbi:hypothetical protein K474DRAFT_1667167 [Panus rudis PR-1116 ss-1]|nr:hypothetical protein K474DRAFT_1667167 [Panus rudis PR-1116 ss-1]